MQQPVPLNTTLSCSLFQTMHLVLWEIYRKNNRRKNETPARRPCTVSLINCRFFLKDPFPFLNSNALFSFHCLYNYSNGEEGVF
jgi:hypothetical protein